MFDQKNKNLYKRGMKIFTAALLIIAILSPPAFSFVIVALLIVMTLLQTIDKVLRKKTKKGLLYHLRN